MVYGYEYLYMVNGATILSPDPLIHYESYLSTNGLPQLLQVSVGWAWNRGHGIMGFQTTSPAACYRNLQEIKEVTIRVYIYIYRIDSPMFSKRFL